MTKIYKFQDDISTEASKELQKCTSLAIDTEGSGLQTVSYTHLRAHETLRYLVFRLMG